MLALFQEAGDSAVHITLGTGIVVVLGKMFSDYLKDRKNKNGNGNSELLLEMKTQTTILRDIQKGQDQANNQLVELVTRDRDRAARGNGKV